MRNKRTFRLIALLPLAVLWLAVFSPTQAQAATFTVNSTGDTNDVNSDGICADVFGLCTLRAAIQEADDTAAIDTIIFNIGGGPGVKTISLTNDLPSIDEPVIIDGWSQGGAGYTGPPLIELNRTNLSVFRGLSIAAGNSTVRGLIINLFNDGIRLQTGGGNRIEGCYIGTDPTGTVAQGNVTGIRIEGSTNNTIGGTVSTKRNIISGNTASGISVSESSSTGDTTNNRIIGNYIGTDVSGTFDLGNSLYGILVFQSANNIIGGNTIGERNIISGNNRDGVLIFGGSSGNQVKGNYIGADINGTADLGNTETGVNISDSSDQIIGTPVTSEGNIIAFNGTGVKVDAFDPAQGNSIRGNSIFSNDSLGIDLGSTGVTPNDNLDPDTGANNLQNFPMLAGAINSGGSTTVQGSLNSTANTTFVIDFYSSNLCDSSEYGEGRNYLGSTQVTTDASGNASISFTPSTLVSFSDFITATATRTSAPRDTSEFSRCVEISPQLVVTNANDSGAGSLRQAILDANATFGITQITFNIPGAGVHTINPTSELPTITEPVIINGTSQPGFAGTPLIALNGTNAGPLADGLNITAGNSRIRSLAINRFSGDGIDLGIGGGNRVEGCFIGTNASGTADLGNGRSGIRIAASPNNIIGGLTSAERNIISGNELEGVLIAGPLSTGNQLKGNYIGTDVTGTIDLGNTGDGVEINNEPSNNIVGGTTAAERNLISGNGGDGIFLTVGANANQIKGNFIGTDVNGIADLGNDGDGTEIGSDANNNVVGGVNSGEGNTIAFNTRGIFVSSATATGNSLRGNSIFSNDNLGIDLGAIGITANDTDDPDTGANNLQNFPIISFATNSGNSVTVAGSLNSTPNTTFTIDFYSNPTCDSSGNGEGQTYIGSTNVTTNGGGNVAFNQTFNVTIPLNHRVTATATDPSGNTSEFATCSAGPTSASVTVGGRVMTADGRGIFKARISMTDSNGNVRMALTNPFGFYRFADVPAGEVYVFNVTHKTRQFTQPFQVLFVNEDNDAINFVASPQALILSKHGYGFGWVNLLLKASSRHPADPFS